MATRFSRRTSQGNWEHHDDAASRDAAVQRENRSDRSSLFGLLGLLIFGVITWLVVMKHGADWPKWLRFGTVLAGAGVGAFVLSRLAELIWKLIVLAFGLALLYGIVALIWKAV